MRHLIRGTFIMLWYIPVTFLRNLPSRLVYVYSLFCLPVEDVDLMRFDRKTDFRAGRIHLDVTADDGANGR